jgi:predicted esterase YcpF (UPF0227 family)
MNLESELFIKKGSKILIISFGGCQLGFGTLALFEFRNFLEKFFPQIDKLFYIDKDCNWYHSGIRGISDSINTTVEHIRKQCYGYEKVFCIGSSAGGYAAIMFGSMLNIHTVLTFNAQTYLDRQEFKSNLKTIINTTTKYHLYGDLSINKDVDHLHHISHTENLEGHENVIVYKKETCNLKEYRDSGELLKIFQGIIRDCA